MRTHLRPLTVGLACSWASPCRARRPPTPRPVKKSAAFSPPAMWISPLRAKSSRARPKRSASSRSPSSRICSRRHRRGHSASRDDAAPRRPLLRAGPLPLPPRDGRLQRGVRPLLQQRELQRRQPRGGPHRVAALAEDSIKLYRAILSGYPLYDRADEATFYLATALQDIGQRDEAVEYFKSLTRSYQDSAYVPDAFVNIGEYWFDKNDAVKALVAYQRATAFRDSDKYAFALYKLGWCYFNVEEYTKAIETMKQVVAYSMSQSEGGGDTSMQLQEEALRDLVRFFADAGEMEDAYVYFEMLGKKDLIRKMPQAPRGHVHRAGQVRAGDHHLQAPHRGRPELAGQPGLPVLESSTPTSAAASAPRPWPRSTASGRPTASSRPGPGRTRPTPRPSPTPRRRSRRTSAPRRSTTTTTRAS